MNAPFSPWKALSLPPEAARIRAMLSDEERQYLVWLTAARFEGWGAIVDLGPWLGASSAMLAEGLRRQGKQNTIHSFDLFRWEPRYMEAAAPENLKQGDDFLHLFLREIGDYASWIEPHKQDLMNSSWNGGPIEILFVDAAKTWELTNAILRGFGPHLVPGRSRVVLQDFRHHTTHWLPLIFDSRPDLWKEAESVDYGTTVTFIPLKPLFGPVGVHVDYTEECFSLESAEHILRTRMAREGPFHRALTLRILYRRYLIDGPLEEVWKLRDQVVATGVSADELTSIEDIWTILVPRGWDAHVRHDYHTSRMLAERCLALTGGRPVYAVALLGMSFLRLGDLEGARRCIDEVATYLPDFRPARLYRAELALEEGRHHDAEADALEALSDSNGDESLIRHSLMVLEQACRGEAGRERAVDVLTGLQGAFTESPTFLTHLAREQFKLGRRTQAIQNVERVLEKAPDDELASKLHQAWKDFAPHYFTSTV